MIFGLIVFLACMPMALLDFALPKWKADKNFRIEDAYKWTYQATRGGEHAVPDTESARKWLDNEWSDLSTPIDGESVWEPLCPGGEIGRLNLRPFKNKGGKAGDILDAFLASSREYRSDGGSFTAAWADLGKRLKTKAAGALTYNAWRELDAKMKAKDYPAIHHSKTFDAAEHPAYRILTSAQYEQLPPKTENLPIPSR